MNNGILYIVATPIGNLSDITFRAVEVLKSVDLIACEDTRVTRVLLDHFNIKKPTVSYHQHSKISKVDYLIEQLLSGKDIALVTDAGTPGISDPANYLVKLVCNKGIKVVPIPGPSALAAAVSVSGIVDKDFYFVGFLPRKKGRQTELKKISSIGAPVVIYESAVRIEKTLVELKEYFGEKATVFIAREMTKKFEEYLRGDISEVLSDLKNHVLKGEFVLLIRSNS